MAGQRTFKEAREVYFVQGFELKLIKIGVTNDTARRMVSMQTFSPDRLAVLGVQICLRRGALEKELHLRFGEHRQHGEWFTPAPVILDYIAQNTVPLRDVPAERARIVADDAVTERIRRRSDQRKERWMRDNGFAHILDG